jgi:hypothetical protein
MLIDPESKISNVAKNPHNKPLSEIAKGKEKKPTSRLSK